MRTVEECFLEYFNTNKKLLDKLNITQYDCFQIWLDGMTCGENRKNWNESAFIPEIPDNVVHLKQKTVFT